MALFKISKGASTTLPALTSSKDGYCYFTTDDGMFYIDWAKADKSLVRSPLNANNAKTLMGKGVTDNITNTAAYIPHAKAVFDALQTRDNAIEDLDDAKMDKANPTGTGSLSINRKANTTTGTASTTLGANNTAAGAYSFASGYESIANGSNQAVFGTYNAANTSSLLIVGNGSSSKRQNAFTIDTTGKAYFANLSAAKTNQILKAGGGNLELSTETLGSDDNPVYLKDGVLTLTTSKFSDFLSLQGGNMTGHIYMTGSKPSSSTSNTSQLVFGTATTQHVAVSSNDNTLVINPNTSATTNQIVLYLDKASLFPSGITSSGTIQARLFKGDIQGNGTGTWTGDVVGRADSATLALTANKLANTTAIGSETKPVYFNASGVPVECGNSLAVSITGNAATATTAQTADSANTANTANTAIHATTADTATRANTANSASYADRCGNVNFADMAGNANYADAASTAGYADNAGVADYATNAGAAESATTATDATNTTNVDIADDTTSKLFVLGATTTGKTRIYRESSVYMQNNVLFGAAWNDYAEYREIVEEVAPGYCVVSNDNGQVTKTSKMMQACDGIVSDTFGFSIGESGNGQVPLAVAGRVLAYCEGNREDYHAGDTVCASPEGKVMKMTREQIQAYPDRIVGIVSEIPHYETWGAGNVKVNGRIWIKVR